MYQDIAKVCCWVVFGLSVSIYLHYLLATFMIIYKGLVRIERVPSVMFYCILISIVAVMAGFVSMVATVFVWPVILVMCVCFAIHPQIRKNIMERVSNPLWKFALFPIMIMVTIHIAISEAMVNFSYKEFDIEYHDVM